MNFKGHHVSKKWLQIGQPLLLPVLQDITEMVIHKLYLDTVQIANTVVICITYIIEGRLLFQIVGQGLLFVIPALLLL